MKAPTAIDALMLAVHRRLAEKNQVVRRVRVSLDFRAELVAAVPRDMALTIRADGEFELDGILVVIDPSLPRGVSFALADEDCA